MKSATNVLLLSQPSLLNVLLCFGDTTLVTFVGVWVLSEIKLSRALWPEVLFVVTLPKSGRWEWVLECAVWVRVREAAPRRRLSALTRSRSFVAFEKPLSKLVTYCTGGTSKRVTHGITAIKCTILLVGSIYIFFGLEHFSCTTCGVLFGTDLNLLWLKTSASL